MLQELFLLLLKASAVYFFSINLVYGTLLVFSWLKIKRFGRRQNLTDISVLPGVSFLIPAYNEEALIVETIQTYLALPIEKKEIIVINDGSHDATFELLQNMFQLRRTEKGKFQFQSITHENLKVLQAPRSGKSLALNTGVEYAKYDLICTMDADTVPTLRGIESCILAFASDKKLVAAGGVIKVLTTEKRPDQLTRFQQIEYLRAFLCERLGWSLIESTLLISGAFCMVKKEALKKIGGFRKDCLAEDFDFIVRLRRAYKGSDHAFKVLPVTTCYTQVPSKLKHLKVQRMRWQKGLVETLAQNSSLLFNPTYRALGLFAVPYFWMVEMLSPFVEAISLLVIPYALYHQWISMDIVLFYLAVGLGINLVITLFGVYLDNKYVSQDKQWNYGRNALETILLHFGYRQLTSWWRFVSNLHSFKKGGHVWGEKPRQEINL